MRGLNKVMLIGNLGKDPEVQYIDNGRIPVARFPLATTETYKDKNGQNISQTEWHSIVLWRGLAELAQKYLKKGSLVFIEGRLRSRMKEDKDKVKRIITEVVADSLVMLDRKKDANNQHATVDEERCDMIKSELDTASDVPAFNTSELNDTDDIDILPY